MSWILPTLTYNLMVLRLLLFTRDPGAFKDYQKLLSGAADLRIFLLLLVRVPVNSFEFHSCEHTPQAEDLTR